ncbi:MAG: hypothetical protein VW450_08485 [Chloroflexota bacterium]
MLLLAALALVACGGPAATPTPRGDAPVDGPAMRALLTTADVEALGGPGGLSVELDDLLPVVGDTNPTRAAQLAAWFLLTVHQGDTGPALVFAVLEFHERADAEAHLGTVLTGPGFAPVGLGSGVQAALAQPDDATGIGAALIALQGKRVISLHTTIADGIPPLLDAAGLEVLARLIAGRL